MNVTVEKSRMKKNLLVLAALAVMLAGCVVVPARPLYVHAPRVVVY
jgi:starvation-inducible outer membrane lipoprotein